MNQKRALLVTTVSGFVPQFEMNNVRILQELGYEVHYASNFRNPHYGKDNSRLEGTGIICHQVDMERSPFCIGAAKRSYRQLKKLLQTTHFELIHCHTPMGGALARLAARSTRNSTYNPHSSTVIYTAHGFHFYKGAPLVNWLLYYPVERWLARYTDKLITINEEDYERAKRFHLRKAGQVFKVNGVGIDVEKYQKLCIDREAKRRELGVGEDELLLVSVGELNKNKNHQMVLKALDLEKILKTKYFICGEGLHREKLEASIKEYQLSERVKLLGYRIDIVEILKAADVFALPSLREGLSLSLQEAMASGLAVLATDIRGNRELVDDGNGGYLIAIDDCQGMGKTLQKINIAEAKKMGEHNRKKIQAYDISTVMQQMRQIYLQCEKGTI